MSAEKMALPAPICESCWLDKYSKWEPESMDENGQMLMKLVDVKMPKKYNLDEPEICADCNGITVSGIFEVAFGADGLLDSDFAPSLSSSRNSIREYSDDGDDDPWDFEDTDDQI